MLEITKSSNYIISTYDVKMVIGSGETEEEALKNYIECAEEVLEKTKIAIVNLEKNINEAKSKINNKI